MTKLFIFLIDLQASPPEFDEGTVLLTKFPYDATLYRVPHITLHHWHFIYPDVAQGHVIYQIKAYFNADLKVPFLF